MDVCQTNGQSTRYIDLYSEKSISTFQVDGKERNKISWGYTCKPISDQYDSLEPSWHSADIASMVLPHQRYNIAPGSSVLSSIAQADGWGRSKYCWYGKPIDPSSIEENTGVGSNIDHFVEFIWPALARAAVLRIEGHIDERAMGDDRWWFYSFNACQVKRRFLGGSMRKGRRTRQPGLVVSA